MLETAVVSPTRQAALTSGVQAGFVIGALLSAVLGIADRFDPRKVFAIAAITAGLINLTLVFASAGSDMAIIARILTGLCLAGVYPVGMKIAVGWGQKDRGLLVSILVGALTLGSALPHLFAFVGSTNWKAVVIASSIAAITSGILCLVTQLGPYHSTAVKFRASSVFDAWTNKKVRFAFIGYFGHMWELYAMWAWVGAIAFASFSLHTPAFEARNAATLTAFFAIALGAPLCVVAGYLADRYGKEQIAAATMLISGSFALLASLSFGGPIWLVCIILIVWGISVIPDSAIFSALVADAAPPENAGSLMTLQTAFGFALTFITVQATPVLAEIFGWPALMATMAIGPAVGIVAMYRLHRLNQS